MEDLSANLSTFDIWYGIDKQKASRWKYYLPGLTKLFFDADKMNPSNGFSSSGKHSFLVGGLTQPINAALYNYGVGKGVVTSTTSNYVNPGNDFNRTVLKKLTTDACTKLKAAGARVYVLKYRKQDKWKAFLRNETSAHSSQAITHSYTEIDACATSSGGKVYDIGTAADDTASNGTSANTTALKETLDAIAADIKDWAGYEDARNVTN